MSEFFLISIVFSMRNDSCFELKLSKLFGRQRNLVVRATDLITGGRRCKSRSLSLPPVNLDF